MLKNLETSNLKIQDKKQRKTRSFRNFEKNKHRILKKKAQKYMEKPELLNSFYKKSRRILI